MTKCIFITGTDTDVGKTYISSLILKALKAEHSLTCGFKPIASGGVLTPSSDSTQAALKNSDAVTLQRHSTLAVPYNMVNPFCFEPAIAPHVAAAEAGVRISTTELDQALVALKQRFAQSQESPTTSERPAQVILTEGAGGWHVPLNERERLSDWVAGQQMGVILVVGLKLGCINHALLTCEAIANAGLSLLGWVANRPSAAVMSREPETLAYLESAIAAPLIANVGYSSDPQHGRFTADAHQALLRAMG